MNFANLKCGPNKKKTTYYYRGLQSTIQVNLPSFTLPHNYNVVSSAAVYYAYDQTNPFTCLFRRPHRMQINYLLVPRYYGNELQIQISLF